MNVTRLLIMNSLYGKLAGTIPWWQRPITSAEHTVYWFMYGKRFFIPQPLHVKDPRFTIGGRIG